MGAANTTQLGAIAAVLLSEFAEPVDMLTKQN